MRVAVMQPYILPYLGYWQMITAVDKFVLFDDVNYIVRGWINRNNILLNNQPHMITLPLEGASSFKKINEIPVTSDMKAREKLCKSISMAYTKAPYFKDVFPMIEKSVMKGGIISDIIYETVLDICNYIGIRTKIMLSSEIDKNCELKAQDKVIHIVKNLGGTTYINSIGGQELYDKDEFKAEGIDLYFLKTEPVEYRQFKKDFVPNLSIIDILMFNSPDEIKELLAKYTLI